MAATPHSQFEADEGLVWLFDTDPPLLTPETSYAILWQRKHLMPIGDLPVADEKIGDRNPVVHALS